MLNITHCVIGARLGHGGRGVAAAVCRRKTRAVRQLVQNAARVEAEGGRERKLLDFSWKNTMAFIAMDVRQNKCMRPGR